MATLPHQGRLPPPTAPRWQVLPAAISLTAIAALAALGARAGGGRIALAALIGALAGIALYHAAFGFTAAWRRWIVERRGAGLRWQFALIFATSLIAYPLIAAGGTIGLPTAGAVAPLSTALLVGAFLFGIGMQFGGGCGSGTLFTVGGGSTRMLVTLAAFILGSLLGTRDIGWWRALPQLPAFSAIAHWGAAGALTALALLLGAMAWLSLAMERARHGTAEPPRRTGAHWPGSLWQGPWPQGLGAAILALVGVLTLLVAHRPWGITAAFALWGAKLALLAGIDIGQWPYWQGRAALLARPVLADLTSVMDLGIIAGAMLAASLADRYRPTWRIGWRDMASAVMGGLLMGYGARLGYGCNIGAYLGGLVSGSLHGLVWMIAAFAGSALAIRIKPRLGW